LFNVTINKTISFYSFNSVFKSLNEIAVINNLSHIVKLV